MRTARVLLAAAVSTLCLLMGLLMSLLMGLVLVPWRAVAAEPPAMVSITITSMDPALPTRDGEITVSGLVTNISKERLYRLEALFWRNQAPILGQAGM